MLGVERTATVDTVRKAYRKLARRHHPDVSQDPKSHDMMARINEAFATLVDPDTRLEYDAQLNGAPVVEEAKPSRKPVVIKLRARLKAHRTPVYALGYVKQTSRLVSGSFDNEVIFWEGEEAIRSRTKLESGAVSVIQPLDDETVVASGAVENTVAAWRVHQGRVESWRNTSEEWVCCVALSPDGTLLASGSLHKSLVVVDTTTGKVVFSHKKHKGAVTSVAFSPDGKIVASGSADCTVKLWAAKTGKLLGTLNAIRSQVTALAFSGDGVFLAVAAVDLSIRVFNLKTGILDKMMFGHEKPIEALAFHPNGWLFASAGRDGAVKLWNADKGLGQLHIAASHMPMTSLAFSPDGSTLAAGSLDKTIRLWSLSVRDEAQG